MSHALLLRLFLSPYFSIPVAMHYLKTYSESIGISHYLCWRMRSMPPDEVEFYWPQICHLLITRPTESNALESFVLERAEEDTHIAMLTFWFMQSALRDLTPTRTSNPRPFAICQRVLHRCHELLFGDPPEPSRSPYRSLPPSPHASSPSLGSSAHRLLRKTALAVVEPVLSRVRVNPHAGAALVGMGAMIAGPAMPGLTDLVGEWAVQQGRRPIDDAHEVRARIEVDKTGGADGPRGRWQQAPGDSEGSDDEGAAGSRQGSRPPPARHSMTAPPRDMSRKSTPPPRPRTTQPSTVTTPSRFGGAAAAYESAPTFSLSNDQRGRDPFDQSPDTAAQPLPKASHLMHQAFNSVPDLYGGSGLQRRVSSRPPSVDALLSAYSLDGQAQLLKSHYCRSEIRFLLLLEDIANRLLVVPKPARNSALRAELTSLNHMLPAEVCMPLWCNADHSRRGDNKGDESTGDAEPSGSSLFKRDRGGHSRAPCAHSRVVRISPGDSVVLNSAERAPYVLHVEILEDDLDFDPTRRENRELLKKIVAQEDMKHRKKEQGLVDSFYSTPPPTFDGFGSPMPGVVPVMPSGVDDLEDAAEEDQETPEDDDTLSPEARKPMPEEEPEEMDLVEQLYGNKLSVRDKVPDLRDSIPLPSAPKNKQLDLEVWNSGSGPGGGPGGADGNLSRRSSMGVARMSGHTTPSGAAEQHMSRPITPASPHTPDDGMQSPKRVITLEDYSERMRTAAVMLAQLNASLVPPKEEPKSGGGALRWIPGTGWITGSAKDSGAGSSGADEAPGSGGAGGKLRLAAAQAAAIRERIMEEMMALEEERVQRMTARPEGVEVSGGSNGSGTGGVDGGQTAEDEGIVRREINKADPSAAVFKESWSAKKSRIRASSPWGHLANWDVISVIVKTGADLRQEQLATQLIERFSQIWKEEKCDAWARFFRILITGESSGLVETITDAVSVHSIKKSEYARRVAEGIPIGHVSLMDHYVNTYGKPDSGIFARARRNFIKSLAGYSVITYLLQIKDRHNGNILVDRDGHLIHIDFGFMLSNSPGGNMGFEAAPFKLPLEYVEIMGGLDSPGWVYFKKLFKEGFEAARKHSDSLITIVELMQKDSKLDCFLLFGENTAHHLRERFALGLTTQAVDAYLERLIVSSTASNFTRLYDTFQYYSQGVL